VQEFDHIEVVDERVGHLHEHGGYPDLGHLIHLATVVLPTWWLEVAAASNRLRDLHGYLVPSAG
jgi:hypothetical protein